MMRALWTAASGMKAQQQNVDVISNNISNVNTVGYKKQRTEFKDLLYQNIKPAVVDETGKGRPVNLEIGFGVRLSSTARDFSPGNLEQTGNTLDFAIVGNGFFAIGKKEGEVRYTKDGSFKVSPFEGELYLVTAEGYRVLNEDNEPITIPSEVLLSSLSISEEGYIAYKDETGALVELDQRVQLVQFSNPSGLESIGSNLYGATSASGEATLESDLDESLQSIVKQGFLETSNIQIADEMVKLIVAQRAYELNSKAIQSADEMLSQANQLKRT